MIEYKYTSPTLIIENGWQKDVKMVVQLQEKLLNSKEEHSYQLNHNPRQLSAIQEILATTALLDSKRATVLRTSRAEKKITYMWDLYRYAKKIVI